MKNIIAKSGRRIQLPAAIECFGTYKQWCLWTLMPVPDRPKPAKVPVNMMGHKIDPHNPANMLTFNEAAALSAATGFGVGFVLTERDPFWFFDIDDCRNADNTWAQIANYAFQWFDGAAVEVSQSGDGLHFFGCGTVPTGYKKRNQAFGIELYTDKRFVALTLGEMRGNAWQDFSAVLAQYVPKHFELTTGTDVAANWTTSPRPEWNGPEDDDVLIEKMIQNRGASAIFGMKATFKQLWEADGEALSKFFPDNAPGRMYDASGADASLFSHLAFWTGCDCERMNRIARRSALMRLKWDQHSSYISRTVLGAIGRCTDVYKAGGDQVGQPYLDRSQPLESASTLCEVLKGNHKFPVLYRQNGQFYLYDGKRFSPSNDENIESEVWRFLGRSKIIATGNDGIEREEKFKPNSSRVKNVVDAMKSLVQLPDEISTPAWLDTHDHPDAREIINCQNGLLHIPTKSLYPHTPAYWSHFTVRYEFQRNPLIPSEWYRFLTSIWPDDPEAIEFLQEFMGYIISNDTSQQKILFIYGPKRSGKGTLSSVLRELVGKENTCSPTLNSLTGSFGLQPLLGKRLATLNDVRLGYGSDQKIITERLLTISGEDAVSVDRKHKDAWHGHLPTRFIMLSNELPRLVDASGALASRMMILKMTNSFFGDEDTRLKSKLLSELPGILNWAIDGWVRLLQRGRLIEPKSSKEAKQELEDLSSPVQKFVREECDIGPGLSVLIEDLYQRWGAFCHREGQDKISTKPTFGRDIKAAVPSIRKTRPTTDNGGRVNRYEGITVKNDIQYFAR